MSKNLKAQFTDWVRKQPADGEYDYSDISGCAFFLFLKQAGYRPWFVSGNMGWSDVDGRIHPYDGYNRAVSRTPHTFGALLARLEAAEQPQ